MKYLVTVPVLCLALIFLYLMQIPDVRATAYPVDTELAGIRVRTSVDAAVARNILMAEDRDMPPVSDEGVIAGLRCQSVYDLPDPDSLRRITRDHSVDTATALLIKCLAGIPEVSLTQVLFLTELEKQRSGNRIQAAFLSARSDKYIVLFVPGWGYLSTGEETGSDLGKPREIIGDMGFETHLVPIEDFGSVEANAAILARSLRDHLKSEKRIILASASSGGPTVALALDDPYIANHPLLAGWINICGVLRGSPVVDRFISWPMSWLPRLLALFEGWSYPDLLSLSQSRSLPRFSEFNPPQHLTILNYIGIPFSGQISSFGRPLYRLLKDMGPNDGLTLITEAMAPGYTIMAVGSDHFIGEDPDIDLKTAALVPVLLKLIEG